MSIFGLQHGPSKEKVTTIWTDCNSKKNLTDPVRLIEDVKGKFSEKPLLENESTAKLNSFTYKIHLAVRPKMPIFDCSPINLSEQSQETVTLA